LSSPKVFFAESKLPEYFQGTIRLGEKSNLILGKTVQAEAVAEPIRVSILDYFAY